MTSQKTTFTKKIIEGDYKDIFSEVITKFPEFDNICIFVKKMPFYGIQHTLRAYAPLLSVVNPKRRRVYTIVINSNKETPILFEDLTREEKIGAMAHEMGHILEYTKISSVRILTLTFSFFISRKFVERFEKRADTVTIERGFAKELLMFREKIFNGKENKFFGYRSFVYMGPDEIKDIMSRYPEIYSAEEIGEIIKINPSPVSKRKNLWYSLFHNLKTFYAFFPGLWQMIYYIYIRKVQTRGRF